MRSTRTASPGSSPLPPRAATGIRGQRGSRRDVGGSKALCEGGTSERRKDVRKRNLAVLATCVVTVAAAAVAARSTPPASATPKQTTESYKIVTVVKLLG